MDKNINDENTQINITEIMEKIKEEASKMPEYQYKNELNKIVSQSHNIGDNTSPSKSTDERIRFLAANAHISIWGKITGNPISKLIKKIVRKLIFTIIEPAFAKQTKYNQQNVNSIFVLQNQVHKMENYIQMLEEKIAYDLDQRDLRHNNFEIGIKERFNNIESNVVNLNTSISHTNENIEQKISENQSIQSISRQLNVINHRLWQAERKHLIPSSNTTEEISVVQDYTENIDLNDSMGIDMDYFLFEEQFRGSEEDIRKKLEIYLPYFKNRKNVLDVGCGRGEFLKMLLSENISSTGIDLDDDMVAYCQSAGLPVLKEDVTNYLSVQNNNSIGGIVSTQVIEHIETNVLIRFIRLAYQKLEPGAYFVAETLNPQSLIVFTEAYFLDPSHIKMLHPYTMKFIMESEGFRDVKIIYSSEVDASMKLPHLKSLTENKQNHANKSIDILNGLLYGSRDYAIIGSK